MDSEMDIEAAVVVVHGLSELRLLTVELANTAPMPFDARWHMHVGRDMTCMRTCYKLWLVLPGGPGFGS